MLSTSDYELKDYVQVATLDQLASDKPVVVELDEVHVCLVRSGGRIYALDDECHPGGSLAQGFVEGKTVTCPHGFLWDIASGNRLSLPGGLAKILWPLARVLIPGLDKRLPVYQVECLGTKVMLKSRLRSSKYYGPWRGKVGGGYRW